MYIFSDKVRILCLSCNVKNPKNNCQIAKNSRNKCRRQCFNGCCHLAELYLICIFEHTTLLYATSHQFFFTHMYFGRKQKGCERSEKMIGVVKKRGIVVLYFFVYALNSTQLPLPNVLDRIY